MDLFKRLFIRDYASTGKPEVRVRYGVTAGVFGICSNALICALKLAVGIIGGSVTVIADAVNNLSDAGSSAVTVAGFRLAARPADREHPYGHARTEYIGALVVSVIILIIGVLLAKSSVEKIVTPEAVTVGTLTYVVLCVSIAVKLFQMWLYRDFAKSISSAALKAAAGDSFNDVLATSAALVSAIVVDAAGVNVDAYFGLAVSVFIVASSFKYMIEAASPLIGQRAPEELTRAIKDKMSECEGVLGVHDLEVHSYGEGRYFAVAHIEVPADFTLPYAHELADGVEREVMKELGVALTVHIDPVDTKDSELGVLRERCEAVLGAFGEKIALHDFRLVRGKEQTKVIFDVAIPYESKVTLGDVEKALCREFADEKTEYHFVLHRDLQ